MGQNQEQNATMHGGEKRRKPPSFPNGRLSLFPHSLSLTLRCPLTLSLRFLPPPTSVRSSVTAIYSVPRTELAEAAAGAACGWGSSEFVRSLGVAHIYPDTLMPPPPPPPPPPARSQDPPPQPEQSSGSPETRDDPDYV
ncbi:hypothetical protein PIB30_026689 [Stylosanthes scabra]|uniref:Uncharacterized protein n=1 Tax=Stylosanthes scabra TaxID=79078 RepID=A0ABU6RB79_9FABA|nr:hypothetical protein [Stylosanthes scabra]